MKLTAGDSVRSLTVLPFAEAAAEAEGAAVGEETKVGG